MHPPMQADLSDHVAAAIIGLPRKLRTVFVMAHVQRKSRGDIAAALGISERRVERRMVKALVACRESLAARGVDLARD